MSAAKAEEQTMEAAKRRVSENDSSQTHMSTVKIMRIFPLLVYIALAISSEPAIAPAAHV